MVLLVTAILNIVGIKLYLFWATPYFDIPMHFLGGFWVALTVVWLWSLRKTEVMPDKLKVVLSAILGALVIGFLWEIYELYFGITFLSDGIRYWRDSGADFIMDYVGGVFGALYGYSLLLSIKKQEQNG